jgi:ribonuclease-3
LAKRQGDYQRLWAGHQRIFTRLDVLQERVGHSFADLALLYEALTHRSALMELNGASMREIKLGVGQLAGAATALAVAPHSLNLPWNERLEFLGDAVLNLAVSQRLMQRSEDLAEGDLSRIRAALVNEEALAEVARGLELGKFLLMGKGAVQNGGRNRDSLLADGLEALIGAVFVDAGFNAADQVVGRLLKADLTGDLELLIQTDFKTMLQELTQEKLKLIPTYLVIGESGPDHAKSFTVQVVINGHALGQGYGASKKRASQNAARHAIEQFRARPLGVLGDQP